MDARTSEDIDAVVAKHSITPELMALLLHYKNEHMILLAKRMADKINSTFPEDDPVHWKDLLALPHKESERSG